MLIFQKKQNPPWFLKSIINIIYIKPYHFAICIQYHIHVTFKCYSTLEPKADWILVSLT